MITQKERTARMEGIIDSFPNHIKTKLNTSKTVSSLISNSVIGDFPISVKEYQNALEDDGVFNSFVEEKISANHFLDIGKMVYVTGYSATDEIKRIIDHEMKVDSENNFDEAKVLFESMIFGESDE